MQVGTTNKPAVRYENKQKDRWEQVIPQAFSDVIEECGQRHFVVFHGAILNIKGPDFRALREMVHCEGELLRTVCKPHATFLCLFKCCLCKMSYVN